MDDYTPHGSGSAPRSWLHINILSQGPRHAAEPVCPQHDLDPHSPLWTPPPVEPKVSDGFAVSAEREELEPGGAEDTDGDQSSVIRH